MEGTINETTYIVNTIDPSFSRNVGTQSPVRFLMQSAHIPGATGDGLIRCLDERFLSSV